MRLHYFSNTQTKVNYFISFIISEERISKFLLSEILSQYGFIRLFNRFGTQLYSFDSGAKDMENLGTIYDSAGQYYIEYGLSPRAYANSIRPVQNMIVGYILVAFVIAVAISVCSAWRLNRLLHEHSDILNQLDLSENDIHRRNIQDCLNEAIHGTVIHADEIAKRLNEVQKQMKDATVIGLMSGFDVDIEDARKILADEQVFQGEYKLLRFCFTSREIVTFEMAESQMAHAGEMLKKYIPHAYVVLAKNALAVLPIQQNVEAVLHKICQEIGAAESPMYIVLSADHSGYEELRDAYGDQKQTTVFEFPRIKNSKDDGFGHASSKPVPLIAYLIQQCTQTNSLVLDCFLGSASTLIACEQLGRICYGVEIEPKFVDVAVKRYLQQVGDANDSVFVERGGEKIPYTEIMAAFSEQEDTNE